MERARNLREIWAWLPAFRVVAETQHLTEGAQRLGVTPAALSRTIAKIEKATGLRLFERVPHGMLLTAAGTLLADKVRDTMRACDDALSQLTPDVELAATVRLTFDDAVIGMLLDHCMASLVRHRVRFAISTTSAQRMAASLLSGEVDLALASAPSTDDRVVCKPVGSIPLRWATTSQASLPPSGAAPSLELPPAVAPPSPMLLRHTVTLVPEVVPLPSSSRTAAAEPMTLWRLTRTRPTRLLLEVAEEVASTARRVSRR